MTREELVRIVNIGDYERRFRTDEENRIIYEHWDMFELTAEDIISILEQVPNDTIVKSDSGWECCDTYCSRAFYNKNDNLIVFTQYDGNDYNTNDSFIELHPKV